MSWTTSFSEATQIERLFVFFFVVGSGLAIGEIVRAFGLRGLEGILSDRRAKAIARGASYTVILAALYVGVYHVLRLDLKSLAVSLGVASVALAFASQQLVQNAIAGILIAVRRPFWYEDWVEIGTSGACRIEDLTLTQTVLRAVDGRLLYLPNATVLSSVVVNYSRSGLVEVGVPLTVATGTDWEWLVFLVTRVAEDHPCIFPNVHGEQPALARLVRGPVRQTGRPTEGRFRPRLLVTELGTEKTSLSVRLWINDIERKSTTISEFLAELGTRMEAQPHD